MVTKKEIADYLGISRAAVSLVLNNTPSSTISASTRNKILQAAKELGYYGDADIIPKICYVLYGREANDPRYMNDLKIIEDTASRYNYGTLFLNVSSEPESLDKLQRLLDHQEIKGFVISGDVDETILDIIQSANVSYILYGFPLEENKENVNYVATDDKKLAYEATNYLISLGHRRIALFLGSMGYKIHQNGLEGYTQALQDAGIDIDKSLVQISNEEDGYELCKRAHFLQLDYTAAFCANTVIQFGALQWLKDSGIAVPQSVSLVGSGLTELAQISVPKLTTFYIPDTERESIVTHLLDIIHSRDKTAKTYFIDNFALHKGGTASVRSKQP